MKVWQCSVCKYVHREPSPPEKCPVCGVDKSRFIEIDEELVPKRPPRRTQQISEAPGPVSPPSGSAAPDAPAPESPAGKPEEPSAPKPPPVQLKQESPEKGFEKIKSLALKHHLHPISVHTPNGLLPVAAILWVLAWLFSSKVLASAALINMIFVVLSLPVVISTGVLEWKKKYQGALTSIFKIKLLAASLTALLSVISLLWYAFNPDVLSGSKAPVFILINIIMVAAAGIAGHIGGKLVFKD